MLFVRAADQSRSKPSASAGGERHADERPISWAFLMVPERHDNRHSGAPFTMKGFAFKLNR
jgi:hypothetical protein